MKRNTNFKRILKYVKPYWFSVTMNLLFNLLAIVFSLFSFSMIVPFLNLLFNPSNLLLVKPEFSINSDALLGLMNYYISLIIIENGQAVALIFICVLLVWHFSCAILLHIWHCFIWHRYVWGQ